MAITDTTAPTSHLVELITTDLMVGMYVSEMDCKWSATPFPLGGFHLRNTGDIELLSKYCKKVVIDTNRGASPRKPDKAQLTMLSTARKNAPTASAIKVSRDTHPVTHSVKQELDAAYQDYSRIQDDFNQIMESVRQGETLKLAQLNKPIARMIDHILANPQTLIWILNTESAPRHRTSYCVRAAVWATILARQIGMNRSEMDVLFLGTLVCDIGMQLLPERLVYKRGPFRKKECLAYRKHVEMGLELLSRQAAGLDEQVFRIVRCHHERHDGLGFPRGIKGDQISSMARFANLGYCFERLLCTNCQERRISPAKAITRLYRQRVIKFPEQLIVEFIHVMGMYPVGSVVELSSGELAIILEQNGEERLLPKVAVITDAAGQQLPKPRVVELKNEQDAANSRTISHSADLKRLNLDLRDYTFQCFGKRVGLGGFGLRV